MLLFCCGVVVEEQRLNGWICWKVGYSFWGGRGFLSTVYRAGKG